MFRAVFTLIFIALAQPSAAELKPVMVTKNIYALVGSLGNRTADNLGNNATFGAIVTEAGVVLIDAGGTYNGAAKINAGIQKITDKPVILVINSGGQDHRWLGNGYWAERGAQIIASETAVEDHQDRQSIQFTMLATLVGDLGLTGTEAHYATETFEDRLDLTIGGTKIEIHASGGAHTPGDSFVWLPEASVVFTGDIVYTERALGILPFSDSQNWISAFEAIAKLDADHVIPGHGNPTDMLTAKADTYDYIVNLRQKMAQHIEAGGDIIDAVHVDQSPFAYLHNYDILSGRNAQAVFEAMEWE